MRRKLGWLMGILLAVSVAACGGQTSTLEFGKQDGEQIRQMVSDFAAAFNAKDVDKIVSFYAPNASLMPPNRSTLRGTDALKGYFQLRVTDEGGSDVAIQPQVVEGHGTLAYVVATFTMKLQPEGAAEPRPERGKVVWILRKLAGQWKFELQIFASDLPPVVPPAE